MREHFAQEMKDIDSNVEIMSIKIEEAINKALHALSEGDKELADRVIEEDIKIDELQSKIEDTCTEIIARQQPVASDLRELITIIKMVSNLERIGDHAKHLARATKTVPNKILDKALPKIKSMAEVGLGMLNEAVDAFLHKNPELAKKAADRDDEIDKVHKELYAEITSEIQKNPEHVDTGVTFLFLNRFMERLGDHVTNVCEWVYFANTGEHIELNK